MSEHFKHRCTLCGYMTSYAGRLKRHLEDCHTADDERPAVTQRKPALKRCRKCGFESTNLVRFDTHISDRCCLLNTSLFERSISCDWIFRVFGCLSNIDTCTDCWK